MLAVGLSCFSTARWLVASVSIVITATVAALQPLPRALEGTLAWLSFQLESLPESDRLTVLRAMEILRPFFVVSHTAPAAVAEMAQT